MKPIVLAGRELEEMFERIDEDGDRSISFQEFNRLMLELDHTRRERSVRAEFDRIDKDRNGRVSFEEFSDWIAR